MSSIFQPVAPLRYYVLHYYVEHGPGTVPQMLAYVWPRMRWVRQPNAERMIISACEYLELPYVKGKPGPTAKAK